MTTFPTLDPVLVRSGTFYIDRQLDRPGRVEVGVGDTVTPSDVVARTGNIEKSFTLYLANELGVPNDSLRKYLAASVGSTVSEGEPIARVRRGLRTAAVRSPATGTLVNVDDAEGTVTLSTSSGPRELKALVHGEVEAVLPDRGVTIRTHGARVYGIVGFGSEASGPIIAGIDRHDREMTSDQVSKDWSGGIVLAGMTVGVPALSRLRDAGVAGVIVGSISEGDIRRFLASSSGADSVAVWSTSGSGFTSEVLNAPFVIMVTEGFGRYPMAEPVFDFLTSQSGNSASMSGQTAVGSTLVRPELYIAGAAEETITGAGWAEVGRTVRIVNAERLGTVATITSDAQTRALSNGARRDYVTVELVTGEQSWVPASNVEVLE